MYWARWLSSKAKVCDLGRKICEKDREEKRMFRLDVDSLKDYLDFDLKRRTDLRKLDTLIRRSAPGLKRYFHSGTPAGEPECDSK